jgi:hypothetical protein
MNTPFKFRHNGMLWTVKQVKKFPDNADLLGQCDTMTHTIRIHEEQSPQSKLATLLHELLHMSFPNNIVKDSTEEKIVSGLELPLLDALASTGMLKKSFRVKQPPRKASKKRVKKAKG